MKTKITKCIVAKCLALGVLLLAACSPGTEPAKSTNAGSNAGDAPKDTQGALNARREGQYATLAWGAAPSGDVMQIDVQRSATGTDSKRTVAKLRPGATGFRDCLPDHYAHWYWVQFITKNNKRHTIGPVRVGPDGAGSAHYINPSVDFKVSVTRTDDTATLVWDFPDDKYRQIKIFRYLRPRYENMDASGNLVATSLEWKSQYKNVLPDANADYWYCFQIIMESGAILYQGPVKAEHAGP